jgi:hypothetical protein
MRGLIDDCFILSLLSHTPSCHCPEDGRRTAAGQVDFPQREIPSMLSYLTVQIRTNTGYQSAMGQEPSCFEFVIFLTARRNR